MSAEIPRGIGVSPGAAVGPVVQVRPPVRPPANEPPTTDAAAEHQRIKDVFESVAVTLEERAAAADETAQQILTATALIARDRGLQKAIGKLLAAGSGPTTAVTAAVEEYAAQFEALGGYFAERVTDLKDVRNRAVARLLGHEDPGVPDFHVPSVIVAHDLAPAETATLSPTMVRAIVTEAGGRTSHTAILAAQMGIPAVVQFPGATGIPAGTMVAVDGDSGEVTLDPSEDYQRELVTKRERRRAALAGSHGPGRTRDGHPVALLANIGGVDDAVSAGAQDLEGVGLSAPSSSSSPATPHRRSPSRPRSTPRSSSPSGRAGSSCAPSTPAPTSRSPSPTSVRRRTRPSASADCGCRPCAPSCSTPSSRRSAPLRRRRPPTSR